MSTTRSRVGVTRAWGPIAVAIVVCALVVAGCAASHYQQVSCSAMSRQSIFLLEAQAVPSATLIPCVLPLPGGWSYGGSQVRSGLVRFWLNSDRAGSHAAEVRLTPVCDLAGATEIPLRSPPAGLRGYEEPTSGRSPGSVRYLEFPGGCVTERLAFTRQSAPALYDQADQFLGFTPRSVYVHGVRDDEGLTLCGAQAPPCPG
jgi:hypothetical protein